MARKYTDSKKFVLGANDTAEGGAIYVKDFKSVVIAVAVADGDTGNAGAMTIKLQGAVSDDKPTFSAVQSQSNRWDYVAANDLQDGTLKAGDTGLIFADNDVRLYEVNTNGLTWLNAVLAAYTAGSADIEWVGYSEN